MSGHSLAAMNDLDRSLRQARPDLLAQQCVRHRVIVLLDLDVIIETDAALGPCGILKRFLWQSFQGRAVKLLEQLTTAGSKMPRYAIVELVEKFTNGRVEFGQ